MAWCSTRAWATVHRSPAPVADLMAGADMAIGAGGITTFERLAMRLPSLLTPAAPNQEGPLRYMEQLGWFRLYRSPEELATLLEATMRNGVDTPPDVVGDGTAALANHLFDAVVRLRTPSSDDLQRMLAWLQDDALRADFMMAARPDATGHAAYWRHLLADPTQAARAIVEGSRHVGACGLRHIGRVSRSAEAWIYIGSSTDRGRGVGLAAMRALLREARLQYGVSRVALHVRRDNRAALALYRSLGFEELRKPLTGAWTGREAEMVAMEVTT